MLAGAGCTVNHHGGTSGGMSALVTQILVGRLLGRDSVVAFEPAAEIDTCTPHRAERPVLRCRRFAADRARPRRIRRFGLHRKPIWSDRHDLKPLTIEGGIGLDHDLVPESLFQRK